MLITCSSCQKKLSVSDGAKSKKVRCPHCKAVFVAEEFNEPVPELEVESIEDEPAEDEPAADESAEDEPAIDADERFVFAPPSPGPQRRAVDPDELHAKAKEATRFSGLVVLLACLSSLGAASCNFGFLAWLNAQESPNGLHLVKAVGALCLWGLLDGVMILFVGIAARQLYKAGSRGLIITGIVMCVLLTADFALRELLPFVLDYLANEHRFLTNAFKLMERRHLREMNIVCAILMANLLGILFNLAAALLSVRALFKNDVRRWYEHQARHARTARQRR